jgi:hypothetical protein
VAIRNQKTKALPTRFLIGGLEKTGAGPMIWTILSKAAPNEENRMNAEQRVNVAISA